MGGDNAESIQRSIKVRQVQKDFKKLFDLYKSILLSEMFAPDSREHPELLPYDNNVTCTYCRCNIFNRFLSCKSCKNLFSGEIEEPYDVCMECYCMGRSCGCQSGHTWVEQWKWKDLIHKYDDWRAQIIDIDGHMTDKTPLPLQEERRYRGTKGTLPRHDSKKVADVRSVECLVDFSVSNLNWLREEEGFGQNAMQRRLHQAELDKLADPSLDPRDIDEDIAYARDGIVFPPVEDANGDVNENGDTHDLDAHNGVDSYYADPNANGDIPRLGQKRGRDDEDDEGNKRRKKKAKKAKKQYDSARPLQPKNISGK
ncbi:hypothetical protein IQ06DRAFT_354369 [Phaeosphaeriaceae sp. SRC1lsM3a]|nr:hypothetical protein IQ06DRAFT_354369 [Stagonospora sp. SRC1lsM3a]